MSSAMTRKEPLFTVASIGDERQMLLCPWAISRRDMDEIQAKFKSGQSLEQIADEMNRRWLYRWWRLKESMAGPAFPVLVCIAFCGAGIVSAAFGVNKLAGAFYVLGALAFCWTAFAIVWDLRNS